MRIPSFSQGNRHKTRSAPGGIGWRKAQLIVVLSLAAAAAVFAANSADSKRYLEDIKTLSAPVMEGRGAGTKGIGLAANMIEQRYQTLGLQPAGTKSYLQPFTVITGARLKDGNRFLTETGAAKSELKLN